MQSAHLAKWEPGPHACFLMAAGEAVPATRSPDVWACFAGLPCPAFSTPAASPPCRGSPPLGALRPDTHHPLQQSAYPALAVLGEQLGATRVSLFLGDEAPARSWDEAQGNSTTSRRPEGGMPRL